MVIPVGRQNLVEILQFCIGTVILLKEKKKKKGELMI